MRRQHVDEKQIVEQHPAGVYQALGDRPVVIPHLFRLLEQGFGHVDGAPPPTYVDSLMVPVIAEAQQRVVAHQSEADGPVDEGPAEVVRNLVEDFPEQENEIVGGVQLREAEVFGEMRQSRLLAEEDHLVAQGDGLVDLRVRHVTVEDPEVDVGVLCGFARHGRPVNITAATGTVSKAVVKWPCRCYY